MRKLWLLLLLTLPLSAADLSGKWSGTIDVVDTAGDRTIKTLVRAEFEQKAGLISGRIGRRDENRSESIRNGKLEGNKVSFEVLSAESTGAIKFNLTWDGDRMEGEMNGAVDVGPIVGKVFLTRE